jgi:hypothetical protein
MNPIAKLRDLIHMVHEDCPKECRSKTFCTVLRLAQELVDSAVTFDEFGKPSGVKMGHAYRLAGEDGVTAAELEALGMTNRRESIVAVIPTTELRPPKEGEWYLSGAIVEGYRARSDMEHGYAIAKLVRLDKVETVVIAARA